MLRHTIARGWNCFVFVASRRRRRSREWLRTFEFHTYSKNTSWNGRSFVVNKSRECHETSSERFLELNWKFLSRRSSRLRVSSWLTWQLSLFIARVASARQEQPLMSSADALGAWNSQRLLECHKVVSKVTHNSELKTSTGSSKTRFLHF
jgi:hypothetical protein